MKHPNPKQGDSYDFPLLITVHWFQGTTRLYLSDMCNIFQIQDSFFVQVTEGLIAC